MDGIDTLDRLVEDVVERNNDMLKYKKLPDLKELMRKVDEEKKKAEGDYVVGEDGKTFDAR